MPVDTSALSSLSSSLEDLITRLGQIAAVGGEDEIVPDLLEVERQLTMSHRRLEKALRQASR